MPVTPVTPVRVGLGLWTSVPWTIVIEGGLWIAALVRYQRARRLTVAGRVAFWTGVALLTLIWYNNITGSPPPSARLAAVGSLITFSLFIAWSYWVGRESRAAVSD